MLDRALRPLKDAVFIPLSRPIPRFVSPTLITLLAFAAGLAACYFATQLQPPYSVACWAANRYLDCLDGALARRRNRLTDLGAFLDALSDFVVFSAVPLAAAYGAVVQPGGGGGALSAPRSEWRHATRYLRDGDGAGAGASWTFWFALAAVEASFHINNFVLFFLAAVLEKRRASGDREAVATLTAVATRPALIESFESSILLGLMLWYPQRLELLCWVMAGAVGFGITQRVLWVILALQREHAWDKNR